MKITAIGVGAAFSNLNFNQCFMLDEAERRMLIDCGYQTGAALYKAGVDLKSIKDVYISHGHADHMGFLEGLGFQRYDWKNKPQSCKVSLEGLSYGCFPVLLDSSHYAPTLIANDHFMKELWEHGLSLGMSCIEGVDTTIDTFFWTKPIKSNEIFAWLGWDCKLVQQIHIMSGSMISNTFGLFMTRRSDGFKIYFTTDSQHCSPRQVEIFYNQADLIFQDCECVGVNTKERKSVFMSGVHANYAQLAGWESANSVKLSKEVKAKMYLSHYQDIVTQGEDSFGNKTNWDAMAAEDGFKGFLKVGQELIV